jgi:hypothetical protein
MAYIGVSESEQEPQGRGRVCSGHVDIGLEYASGHRLFAALTIDVRYG